MKTKVNVSRIVEMAAGAIRKAVPIGTAVLSVAAAQAASSVIVTNFGNLPEGSVGTWTQGSDKKLYGVTYESLFRISTDGTGYTEILKFGEMYGTNPPYYTQSGPIAFGDSVYGTTIAGGANNKGTYYTYNITTGVSNYYSLNGNADNPYLQPFTPDGTNVYIVSSISSTAFPYGTVAKYSNGIPVWTSPFNGTNGRYPNTELSLGTDGELYVGVASSISYTNGGFVRIDPVTGTKTLIGGFTNGSPIRVPVCMIQGPNGEIFGLTGLKNYCGAFRFAEGTGVQVLHILDNGDLYYAYNPEMVLGPDGAIYATTILGGTNGTGNFFRLTTNGLFTDFYSYRGVNTGQYPFGVILGKDNNFYANTRQSTFSCWRFSIPMPTSITAMSSSTNGLALSFLSVRDQQYQVFGSTNMLDWTQVGSTLTATGAVTQIIDADLQFRKSYRVKIVSTNYPAMDTNSFVPPLAVYGPFNGVFPAPDQGNSTNAPGDPTPPQ